MAKRTKILGIGEKIYGVPKLPMRIDAMYDNICRGNLAAYYLDADPVRTDPIYKKLKSLESFSGDINSSGSERYAGHLRDDMKARQMTEKVYNHIKKMPLWLLKLEFAIKHERNHELRKEINSRKDYMYRTRNKEWTDAK